jgi:MFS family permease
VTALVVGVTAAVVTSLAAGLVVAAVVAAGLLFARARARVVAVLGALGFILAGCLGVITGQAAHHYLPGSNWAGSFVHASNLIWIGLALLLADAVIVSVAGRSRSESPRPTPPGSAERSPPM